MDWSLRGVRVWFANSHRGLCNTGTLWVLVLDCAWKHSQGHRLQAARSAPSLWSPLSTAEAAL